MLVFFIKRTCALKNKFTINLRLNTFLSFCHTGIGIDDMFILMSGMAEATALTTDSIKDRMKFMMKKSGVAITITSITDLLAFTIGATSVFVSIRIFCIYTGKKSKKIEFDFISIVFLVKSFV